MIQVWAYAQFFQLVEKNKFVDLPFCQKIALNNKTIQDLAMAQHIFSQEYT